MSDISYLTAEGAERLKNELEKLKGPARQKLSERLRAAIQQGDLSENADYHSAKEEQGFLEGRIQELERILKNVVIIDENRDHYDAVDVGAHVTIQEEDFPPETYHVVGPKEADPRRGRISYESPIGSALMGRKVGETVSVTTPNGELKLTIQKIE